MLRPRWLLTWVSPGINMLIMCLTHACQAVTDLRKSFRKTSTCRKLSCHAVKRSKFKPSRWSDKKQKETWKLLNTRDADNVTLASNCVDGRLLCGIETEKNHSFVEGSAWNLSRRTAKTSEWVRSSSCLKVYNRVSHRGHTRPRHFNLLKLNTELRWGESLVAQRMIIQLLLLLMRYVCLVVSVRVHGGGSLTHFTRKLRLSELGRRYRLAHVHHCSRYDSSYCRRRNHPCTTSSSIPLHISKLSSL